MAELRFVTNPQHVQGLTQQLLGVYLDYKSLIFRGIGRLFSRESLLRRSNK